MLRQLRSRLTYANVVATMALFVALGGTAYAVNTVGSTDIIDGQVKSVDIGDGEIGSADIKDNSVNTFDVHSFLGVDVVDGTLTGADIQDDAVTAFDIDADQIFGFHVVDGSIGTSDISDGFLNDEDVGQATFVNFLATIGPVAAQGCAYLPITGINATADHLLLTPSSVDAAGGMIYAVQYRQGQESAFLQACNNNDVVIDDGTTHFNLLVFDAQ